MINLFFCKIRLLACFWTLLFLAGCTTFEIPKENYLPVQITKQTQSNSCGAAALVAVINYLSGDGNLREEDVLKGFPPKNVSGYTPNDLREISENMKFRSFFVAASEESIVAQLEKNRPIILPIVRKSREFPRLTPLAYLQRKGAIIPIFNRSVPHFVVVVGKTKRGYLLADSDFGYFEESNNILDRQMKRSGQVFLLLAK